MIRAPQPPAKAPARARGEQPRRGRWRTAAPFPEAGAHTRGGRRSPASSGQPAGSDIPWPPDLSGHLRHESSAAAARHGGRGSRTTLEPRGPGWAALALAIRCPCSCSPCSPQRPSEVSPPKPLLPPPPRTQDGSAGAPQHPTEALAKPGARRACPQSFLDGDWPKQGGEGALSEGRSHHRTRDTGHLGDVRGS